MLTWLLEDGSCPDDWHYYSGSCFFASEKNRSQPKARQECQKMGGDLASISNQDEMNFVENIS